MCKNIAKRKQVLLAFLKSTPPVSECHLACDAVYFCSDGVCVYNMNLCIVRLLSAFSKNTISVCRSVGLILVPPGGSIFGGRVPLLRVPLVRCITKSVLHERTASFFACQRNALSRFVASSYVYLVAKFISFSLSLILIITIASTTMPYMPLGRASQLTDQAFGMPL